MRYEQTSFKVLALLTAVAIVGACGGQQETPMTEADSAAAAAPPPAPDAFTLVAKDGSWSADIAGSGIVFRRRGRDSLMFDFKEPDVTGAISQYESLMMGQDTVRITVSLAMAKCTDSKGAEYTHLVQLWLTGDVELEAQGCANKKM